MKTKKIKVDITGGNFLQLVVLSGEDKDITSDHADWAGAKLSAKPMP